MDTLKEVIITTDASNGNAIVNVYDQTSVTCLKSLKKSASFIPKNSITFLRDEYILAAETLKPLIHIWQMNGKNQGNQNKFVTSGPVGCLDATPDGIYLIAGIAEKIYVWHVSSGKLLNILESHYRNVVSLRFTDDGSHFVSAADDGFLLVWSLAEVVSNVEKTVEPKTKISDHSMRICDVFVGKTGISCRFVTVSLDQTCRVYELAFGRLLQTIIFDEKLTAVTMNKFESSIFVGSEKGSIFYFDIARSFKSREHHLTEDEKMNVFKGHTKTINHLCVTIDNKHLISASDDAQVIIWNVNGRVKIRSISHKSAVTNLILSPAYKTLTAETIDHQIFFKQLQKSLESARDFTMKIMTTEDVVLPFSEINLEPIDTIPNYEIAQNSSKSKHDIQELLKQIETLKATNQRLFNAKLDECFESDLQTKSAGNRLANDFGIKTVSKNKARRVNITADVMNSSLRKEEKANKMKILAEMTSRKRKKNHK